MCIGVYVGSKGFFGGPMPGIGRGVLVPSNDVVVIWPSRGVGRLARQHGVRLYIKSSDIASTALATAGLCACI